jgi:hypothetical protein
VVAAVSSGIIKKQSKLSTVSLCPFFEGLIVGF